MTPDEDLRQRILHDRDGLIVVDKPAGLATTGKTLDDPDSLEHRLARLVGRRVWAVHQLDTGTSGLVLFVRRRALVAPTAARLKPPTGEKRYLAVAHGSPAWRETLVDAPLGPCGSTRTLGVTATGRPARTHLLRVAAIGGHCVLVATLLTGRTHQVRLHLAHLGLPLVGEPRYREPPCALHPRPALHAAAIDFHDGHEPRALRAPLPADLLALLKKLGFAADEVWGHLSR